MNLRPQGSVRWIAAGMALVAATACYSHPNPSEYEAGVMGVNGQVGPVQLLSVHVEGPATSTYAAGATARLWLTLRNSGPDPDSLTSVTTPVAQHAEIRWDDDCDGRFETVDRLVLDPAVPVPQDSPGDVPPFDAYHIRLVDLNRDVLAGTAVPVTFRFAQAGTLTLNVTVQPSVPRAEPSTRCVSPRA